MPHDVWIWFVPMTAMFLGLLFFALGKDKVAQLGGYVFVCGFFIVLWLTAFGRPALR